MGSEATAAHGVRQGWPPPERAGAALWREPEAGKVAQGGVRVAIPAVSSPCWGGSQLVKKLNVSRKEDGPNSTKKAAAISGQD